MIFIAISISPNKSFGDDECSIDTLCSAFKVIRCTLSPPSPMRHKYVLTTKLNINIVSRLSPSFYYFYVLLEYANYVFKKSNKLLLRTYILRLRKLSILMIPSSSLIYLTSNKIRLMWLFYKNSFTFVKIHIYIWCQWVYVCKIFF